MDYNKLENAAQEILDIKTLKEQREELLERIIEQLTLKLDFCTGIPIVGLFTTIHKVGKSFFDYNMCMRLVDFYIGCRNIDQQKKERFYRKNVHGKEKEVGYMILQLLERIDYDEKATLIGKLYILCVENEYDLDSFFRICRCVERCFYYDLPYLKYWKETDSICSQNKMIPQEIMESLYNDGLLLECGIDGGGFKEDDDAGTIYALNRFGKILVDLL